MAPQRGSAEAVVQAVLGSEGQLDVVRRLTALQHGGAVATGDTGDAALGELRAAGGLVDKVARHAYRITEADIEAARSDGFTDHELFDLIVAAALGAGVSRRTVGRSVVDRWERAR
jgi:alkylhydroperoxidase family enzyme